MATSTGDDAESGDRSSDRSNDMTDPHDHAAAAGAPGASGPGDAGYEGEAMVGDEGAAAGPQSFQDPFGRPEDASEPPGAP
ncbi:MAG: hypothetical protein M3378_10465 [Actinomycetota bacterium]|nr:hypothetical protein [Actinomycetota bacterium]MDQ3680940.1 hypothetical protein [Actinomycetota bacterium]